MFGLYRDVVEVSQWKECRGQEFRRIYITIILIYLNWKKNAVTKKKPEIILK